MHYVEYQVLISDYMKYILIFKVFGIHFMHYTYKDRFWVGVRCRGSWMQYIYTAINLQNVGRRGEGVFQDHNSPAQRSNPRWKPGTVEKKSMRKNLLRSKNDALICRIVTALHPHGDQKGIYIGGCFIDWDRKDLV